MVINRWRGNPIFVLALTGFLAVSCSKDAERTSRGETVALGGGPAQVATESTAVAGDTGSVTRPDPAIPASKTGAAAKLEPRTTARRKQPGAPARRDTARATTPADTSPAPSGSKQGKSMSYDAATNTVTFELVGGPTGFAFNGYTSGGATLTVPPAANMVINFVNKDGTPHSAAIISGEGPLPNADGDPAIPRAYTRQLLQGLAQEEGDAMRFTAPERGTFRIFCGVPGHGLSGMWIWMKVDPAAKAPSFGATK